jgi:hypothetical protein
MGTSLISSGPIGISDYGWFGQELPKKRDFTG